MGMLKNPTWRRVVERYLASTISPLQGWPDEYTAAGHDAILELRVAIRAEEERASAARSKSGATTAGPVWPDKRGAARP